MKMMNFFCNFWNFAIFWKFWNWIFFFFHYRILKFYEIFENFEIKKKNWNFWNSHCKLTGKMTNRQNLGVIFRYGKIWFGSVLLRQRVLLQQRVLLRSDFYTKKTYWGMSNAYHPMKLTDFCMKDNILIQLHFSYKNTRWFNLWFINSLKEFHHFLHNEHFSLFSL